MFNQIKTFFEVLTDIIFHKTSVDNAYNIINKNKLQLSSVFVTEADNAVQKILGHKIFYASFARSSLGSYINDVTFKLDGRQLNYKYKSYGVDYWNQLINRINAYTQKKVKIEDVMSVDEMEDRLFSEKPVIFEFNKYIQEVHVFLEFKYLSTQQAKNYILLNFNLYKICNRKNIPIYFYTNQKAYYILNKNKALIDKEFFNLIKDKIQLKNSDRYFFTSDKGSLVLSAILTGWYADNFDKIKDNSVKNKIYDLLRSYDTKQSVQAEMSNSRTRQEYKNSTNKISELIHKYGNNSLSEFIKTWKEKVKEKAYKNEINIFEFKSKLNVILERLEATVYLRSTVSNIAAMLMANKLILNKDNNLFSYKLYHEKQAGLQNLTGNIVVVLDGEKINQRYAGDSYPKVNGEREPRDDKVYSNNRIIPNFNRYIREIHILVDGSSKNNTVIQSIADKLNIKVYYYNDKTAFKLLNKLNAVDINAPKNLQQQQKKDLTEMETAYYIFMDLMIAKSYWNLSPMTRKWVDNTREGKNKLLIYYLTKSIFKHKDIETKNVRVQAAVKDLIKSYNITDKNINQIVTNKIISLQEEK